MRYKMLVVDNDFQTIQNIKGIFNKKKDDISFITSDSAEIAIEMAWKEKPEIIIVNKTLPDLSGLEVLEILKKNRSTRLTPFIMLDDKPSGIEDEIKALDLGADDYMSKPLNAEVFYARIKGALHRYLTYKEERPEAEEILKSGKTLLNMTTHIAYVEGKPIDLTPKEFALLYLFIKKQSRVLNRAFLSGTIWEHDHHDTSHTIDKHISNLRKKLGSEGEKIKTLPTIGYKFIEEEDDEEEE